MSGVLEQSGKIWKKVFKAVHKFQQVEQLKAVQCVHKCPQVEQLKAVQCVFQPVLKRSSLRNCKKVSSVLEQSGKIWKKVFKAVHKCPQVEQLNAVQCVHKCPQVEQLKAVQRVFQPVLKRSSLIRNETI